MERYEVTLIRRPMIPFYGSKFRLAKHYPSPLYNTIREPFAGGAGYSLRYHWKRVELSDSDDVICGIWDYLIRSSYHEIIRLPLLRNDLSIPNGIPTEARNLIGFWTARGRSTVPKSPSAWCREPKWKMWFWCEEVRQMIAQQSCLIKHWKISNICYREIDTEGDRATWLIDPPYQGTAGRAYRHSNVDYHHLSQWVDTLSGQVIVCDQIDATWKRFDFLNHSMSCKGVGDRAKRSIEGIYYKEQ